MKTVLIATILAGIAFPAFASGTHEGGHQDMAAGEPGKASKVTRTIKLTMDETDDGRMIFTPNAITAKKGETVRIAIVNAGEGAHEFVLDNHEKIMEHKALMEKFPEMEHDDPNAIRLEAGKKGDIIWTFSKDGDFHFACLMPGHYESGMHGQIKVAAK